VVTSEWPLPFALGDQNWSSARDAGLDRELPVLDRERGLVELRRRRDRGAQQAQHGGCR
jgi:hypothetical protein